VIVHKAVGHQIPRIINDTYLARHFLALFDNRVHRIGLADVFETGSERKVFAFHIDEKNFFLSEEL
jgi:hypothetical protein